MAAQGKIINIVCVATSTQIRPKYQICHATFIVEIVSYNCSNIMLSTPTNLIWFKYGNSGILHPLKLSLSGLEKTVSERLLPLENAFRPVAKAGQTARSRARHGPDPSRVCVTEPRNHYTLACNNTPLPW